MSSVFTLTINYDMLYLYLKGLYMVPPKEQWADILAKMRDERYLSAAEQAKQVGVSYNTLKKIIDGEIDTISLTTLRRIHDFLEKDINGN